ncbi:MAG: DUF302 domain-containing protein [Gammaproteobacteria bacterium]|nr:DUF302 domain-containing protein [Gammaproteobacteria bacterium]
MRRYFLVLSILLGLFSLSAQAAEDGLITKKSAYTVAETLNRLERALKKKGITVAMRWNHAAKANAVDIPVQPMEILIFGNPKMGSHLFTSNPTAGIDLPMKALAWQDDKGHVYLSYNDPAYIAKRHHIKDRKNIFKKMSKALNKLSNMATGRH